MTTTTCQPAIATASRRKAPQRGFRYLFDYADLPEKRELSQNPPAVYMRKRRAALTEEQKEAIREKNRAYRKAHREKTRAWNNEYRAKNDERERQKRRAYKIRNREKNNESSRLLNVRRAREHKEHFINYKGGSCVHCGYKYTGENGAAFDFHHINPAEKDTNLRMANGLASLQKEVGQVRCRSTHHQPELVHIHLIRINNSNNLTTVHNCYSIT